MSDSSNKRNQHASLLGGIDLVAARRALKPTTPLPKPAKTDAHGDFLAQQRQSLKKTGTDLSKPFVNPSQIKERPKQHYIMSPLDHTENLFNNAYGMARHKQSRNKLAVQPVFLNHQQRISFRKRVDDELTKVTGVDSASNAKRKALQTLSGYSSLTGARMSMQGVENARLYVQGHGSPGKHSISSDAEVLSDAQAQMRMGKNKRVESVGKPSATTTQVKERASTEHTASTLLGLGVTAQTDLRANSCYSGTEKKIKFSSVKSLKSSYASGTVANKAGNWDKTFAGGLQAELNRQAKVGPSLADASGLANNHKFAVKGYMGPTSQGGVKVNQPDGSTGTHFRVKLQYKDGLGTQDFATRRSKSGRTG
ncbi:hypothetical protein [Chitinolyticbacter meiyuanensis]|uniref:hypothetical protein n=1 Tax=Chitinolyticbacter meiyuanensis TaxID=682798 RepID=UPI0011E5F97C|nr:hypothetical protein [Chitinolyticbacter meiyuanensis]